MTDVMKGRELRKSTSIFGGKTPAVWKKRKKVRQIGNCTEDARNDWEKKKRRCKEGEQRWGEKWLGRKGKKISRF